MFGWSYPEDQTATWMSDDTRIQLILLEALKKLDHGSMQETDAEQPTIQSKPQCSPSDHNVLINEKEMGRHHCPVNTARKYELGYQISRFVEKLVRHENRRDRETGGAIHWRLMSQKLKLAFLEAWRRYLALMEIGSITIWKGSSKTRSSVLPEFLCNTLLKIRAIQGHTGRHLIEPELMGHVAIPFNRTQFCFHRGCSFNLKSILEAGLIAGE